MAITSWNVRSAAIGASARLDERRSRDRETLHHIGTRRPYTVTVSSGDIAHSLAVNSPIRPCSRKTRAR